jgi:phytoene/squalene synthetase
MIEIERAKFKAVGSMPFALRRPWLLMRGTFVNRERPDLAQLRSIEDPERFAWAIIPHVARSFAASIVLLPRARARVALVGYLYARMLDTYEDMVPDIEQRIGALQWFAERFSTGSVTGPAPAVKVSAANRRQEVDRLLVERRELVDRLYATLPESDQARITGMVTAMATSMQGWTETFARQGGVLETEQQLSQYCDDVIGEPARFAISLLVHQSLSDSQRRSTSTISEMVQLANVTRDIEKDLERNVGYHPSLRPFLGGVPDQPDAVEQVRKVREELLVRALKCVPAYRRLLEDLSLPAFSAGRGSAVLMLLFTDRHYRACAVATGHKPWRGRNSTAMLLLSSLLAVVSRRWANRILRRVESRFLGAAEKIERAIPFGAAA